MDLEMGGILIRTMIKEDDHRRGQLWPLRHKSSVTLESVGSGEWVLGFHLKGLQEEEWGECGGSKHKLLV